MLFKSARCIIPNILFKTVCIYIITGLNMYNLHLKLNIYWSLKWTLSTDVRKLEFNSAEWILKLYICSSVRGTVCNVHTSRKSVCCGEPPPEALRSPSCTCLPSQCESVLSWGSRQPLASHDGPQNQNTLRTETFIWRRHRLQLGIWFRPKFY